MAAIGQQRRICCAWVRASRYLPLVPAQVKRKLPGPGENRVPALSHGPGRFSALLHLQAAGSEHVFPALLHPYRFFQFAPNLMGLIRVEIQAGVPVRLLVSRLPVSPRVLGVSSFWFQGGLPECRDACGGDQRPRVRPRARVHAGAGRQSGLPPRPPLAWAP